MSLGFVGTVTPKFKSLQFSYTLKPPDGVSQISSLNVILNNTSVPVDGVITMFPIPYMSYSSNTYEFTTPATLETAIEYALILQQINSDGKVFYSNSILGTPVLMGPPLAPVLGTNVKNQTNSASFTMGVGARQGDDLEGITFILTSNKVITTKTYYLNGNNSDSTINVTPVGTDYYISYNITLSGLVTGLTYEIQGQTFTNIGVSPASNIIMATPRSIVLRPTITNIVASDSQIVISFMGPEVNDSDYITRYNIQYFKNDGSTPVDKVLDVPDQSGGVITDPNLVRSGGVYPNYSYVYTYSGLTNGAKHKFQINSRAFSTGTTDTAYSDPLDLFTLKNYTPFTLANPPTVTATTVIGSGEIVATWTQPDLNGLPLHHYVARLRTGSTFVANQRFEVTGTTYTFTGLTDGTSYTVEVWAVTENINLVTPTYHDGYAGVFTIIPFSLAGPVQTYAIAASDGKLTASWTAPASRGGLQLNTYRVSNPSTSSTTPALTLANYPNQLGASTTSIEFNTNLVNGTRYYISVVAITLDPNFSNGATLPAQLDNLRFGTASTLSSIPFKSSDSPTVSATTVIGSGEIVATWTQPNLNGLSLDKYVVQLRQGTITGTIVPGSKSDVTGTTYTFTGLTDGTKYVVEVWAVTINTTVTPTAYQNGVSGFFSITPFSLAGPVQTYKITASDGKLISSWTTPSSLGGLPLYQYRMSNPSTSPTAPALTLANYNNITPYASDTTNMGLVNGITYYISIVATTLDPNHSNGSTSTLPAQNVGALGPERFGTASKLSRTPFSKSPTVSGVTTTVTSKKIVINFVPITNTPPSNGGFTITGYSAVLKLYGGAEVTRTTLGASATQVVFDQLTNGQSYEILLSAIANNIDDSQPFNYDPFIVSDKTPSGDPIIKTIDVNYSTKNVTMTVDSNGGILKEFGFIYSNANSSSGKLPNGNNTGIVTITNTPSSMPASASFVIATVSNESGMSAGLHTPATLSNTTFQPLFTPE